MTRQFRWHWAVLAAMLLATPAAFGQRGGFSRGGFSPEGMFDRLDQDGSGVIEPEEIEESRMSFMIDRMGLDTSKAITRDDLSNSMDQMRRRMEESGGSGGWGGSGRGSSDRGGWGGGFRGRGGGDDGERDDDGRGRWWSRWGGAEEGRDGSSRRRSSRDRDGNRAGGPTATTKAAEPPPRVTLDLQQEFVAGDADGDGQIGMYEWTKWKSRAALAQFLGLDRNGDGFLTPRELARAHEATPVDLATALPSGPSAAQNQASVLSAAPNRTASPQQSTRPSEESSLVSLAEDVTAVIAEADMQMVRKAKDDFSLLDQNRDGILSELEWTISKRIKPRFEKAGVDLGEPMSSDQFVGYYVRIFAADGSS